MPDFNELLSRIDRLAAQARRPSPEAALLVEIEDVLAEGYMRALTEEARSKRLGARMEHLVETLDEPGAAAEARRLAVQRRTLDEKVRVLRGGLDAIREQFMVLGGGSSTPR